VGLNTSDHSQASFIYPKSWDLLDHGYKGTKTERSGVAVAVCPGIQKHLAHGGNEAEVNKANSSQISFDWAGPAT